MVLVMELQNADFEDRLWTTSFLRALGMSIELWCLLRHPVFALQLGTSQVSSNVTYDVLSPINTAIVPNAITMSRITEALAAAASANATATGTATAMVLLLLLLLFCCYCCCCCTSTSTRAGTGTGMYRYRYKYSTSTIPTPAPTPTTPPATATAPPTATATSLTHAAASSCSCSCYYPEMFSDEPVASAGQGFVYRRSSKRTSPTDL